MLLSGLCVYLAGAVNPYKPFLFTDEQEIKILIDQAIFSDSMAARTRAVNQLTLNYGSKARPALKEILESIPAGEAGFRTFCLSAIGKLRHVEDRALSDARFLERDTYDKASS